MPNTFALLVVVLVATACGSDPTNEYASDGATYKRALADLVRRSDRIVATEHSDELDLYDSETDKSEIQEQITYGERELTRPEQQFFLATIESLDPKTQDAFTSCVPTVHHTFRFYSGSTLVDTVDVCFECSQVLWSGTRAVPPWSIYTGLAKVVKHIGFSPERDWPEVARQHLKNSRSNTSLERT